MTAKKREGVECYSLSGTAVLKGFVKNGLDSSTLINLIVSFDNNLTEFKRRGFTFPPNIFFYHEISWPEVIGVLINEYGFTKDEAKAKLKDLIQKLHLIRIRRMSSDTAYEALAKKANEKVVRDSGNPKLRIGDNDVIIIGGFHREGITFAHSGDNGFLRTCKELKINIIPTPKKDIGMERYIKERLRKNS